MKILLVPSEVEEAVEAARLLCSRCIVAGLDTYVQPPSKGVSEVDPEDLALVVSMGGDGTFLRAVHLMEFKPVPVLGLNHGTLGFLCGNPQRDELELIIDALAGDLHVERRSTVDATITDSEGHVFEVTAFNELAYSRGSSGHIVQYDYSINGTKVAKLNADGLVISSATGSTAYALSAGGPIVSPSYQGMVVVPLSPHTLNSRAIVLAPSDVVEVEMYGRSYHEASLFVDGVPLDIDAPVSIVAHRGKNEVIVVDGGCDFFANVSNTFFGGCNA